VLPDHHVKLSAPDIFQRRMPLSINPGAPTLFIRRAAYERAGLSRAAVDEQLGLTADEFRVEGDVVVIGPIFDGEALAGLLDEFERLGLEYYDDFFELSGNWPEWLSVFAGGSAVGRNSPSQPHS
jgi:hypothetical protein